MIIKLALQEKSQICFCTLQSAWESPHCNNKHLIIHGMLDRDSIHILYRVSGYGSIPQSTDDVRGLVSSPNTLTKLNPSLLHHQRSFTVLGIFIRRLKNFLIPLGRNIYCSYKCLVKQPEDKCHTSSPTINSVYMCVCVSLCVQRPTHLWMLNDCLRVFGSRTIKNPAKLHTPCTKCRTSELGAWHFLVFQASNVVHEI
jgi:hypothetical protein